jgi:hypothetical protein
MPSRRAPSRNIAKSVRFPLSIDELDDKPQADWTKEDWRSLALFAVKLFRETVATAEQALERADRQSQQYVAFVDEAVGVNETLINAQQFAVGLLADRVRELLRKKRGRGRPRKVTPETDSKLLAFFETARDEFVLALPGKRPTVGAVLTWQFERDCVQVGVGAHRAHSAEFKKKLKTMRNRVSDARNPTKKNP